MNLLTDLYHFEKLPDIKSEMRLDCTSSTNSYPELERLRDTKGNLFVYVGDIPRRFKRDKACKAITKGRNISSILTGCNSIGLGSGDIKDTQDALLFLFNKEYSSIDILVARGQKANREELFAMLIDGELDAEIKKLRCIVG